MALTIGELLQLAVITDRDVDNIVTKSQPKLKPYINAEQMITRGGDSPLNRLLNTDS